MSDIKNLNHEEMMDFIRENEDFFKTVTMYCNNHDCGNCIFSSDGYSNDYGDCMFDYMPKPYEWNFSEISIKEESEDD